MGHPVLLIEGKDEGFSFGLDQWDKRQPDEPQNEIVIQGPREGFTETLTTNLSMLRRRIRSPQLKMRGMDIGTYTQTRVITAYIEGIADSRIVQQVTDRLQDIKIDGVLDAGYLEEFISNPKSPFPQVLTTERADVVTANLLEGRIAILVNGSPTSLIVPVTLASLLQSPEDYYTRGIFSTIVRWLRYTLFLVSLLLPSFYIALITFHQEMVPSDLMFRFVSSREAIPYPSLIEALPLEIALEALREAGLRLPKAVGPAITIVGALVIGEAAVSAGLVSQPLVIVVAITAIASFVIPRYFLGFPQRMLRFPLMFASATLGILGFVLSVLVILMHLSNLNSFGVPYLSPLSPAKTGEWKDIFIRVPWPYMNTRPSSTKAEQIDRQPNPSRDTQRRRNGR